MKLVSLFCNISDKNRTSSTFEERIIFVPLFYWVQFRFITAAESIKYPTFKQGQTSVVLSSLFSVAIPIFRLEPCTPVRLWTSEQATKKTQDILYVSFLAKTTCVFSF